MTDYFSLPPYHPNIHYRSRRCRRRSHEYIPGDFNCELTDEVRERLKERRRELSLSYQQVAMFFGVNWSTFRKWEEGPTRTCSLCHRRKIERFLNGEYDSKLLCQVEIPEDPETIQPIRLCMERLMNTYVLCQTHPEIAMRLIVRLEEIAHQAIEELVSGGNTELGIQVQDELQKELDAFEQSKKALSVGWDPEGQMEET